MVSICSWWQAFIPVRYLIYFLWFLLWLSPLVHVLFHALFDFHPFHCDKRTLMLLYCFAANMLIHGAFIWISLIKSKNDNEAAAGLRHCFKSNWHTEDPLSMKPASWLQTKPLIDFWVFFYQNSFFPYKVMFLPYGSEFQYIPGGAIQLLHGSNWQSIKDAFVTCYSYCAKYFHRRNELS